MVEYHSYEQAPHLNTAKKEVFRNLKPENILINKKHGNDPIAKIGDFGFSGKGAAGFELDHIDSHLTSIKNITLLAQSKASKNPKENFILVPESQLTHLSNIKHLPNEEILQADMVYFNVPGGGSVFSTGSITFCGSLPWNKFNNNVSKLLQNIINKSISK